MMKGVFSLKTTTSVLIFVLLAVSGMALLAGNANAQISMSERENVQTIVWVIEFATFISTMAIGWFVWRIIKRDSKNKISKRDDGRTDCLPLVNASLRQGQTFAWWLPASSTKIKGDLPIALPHLYKIRLLNSVWILFVHRRLIVSERCAWKKYHSSKWPRGMSCQSRQSASAKWSFTCQCH
jgi:hypothetical protein